MRYEPGDLLKEYTVNPVSKSKTLVGSFLVISITEIGAHTVTLYDRDGFWKPPARTFFPHTDIRNRNSWKWEIQ